MKSMIKHSKVPLNSLCVRCQMVFRTNRNEGRTTDIIELCNECGNRLING